MTNLDIVFKDVSRDIEILLANGRSDDKMKLGISNQDYPEARDEAANRIIFLVLKAEIAESIILNDRFLYHSAALDQYVKFMKSKLGKTCIAG